MLMDGADRGFPRAAATLGALLAERDILRSGRAFSTGNEAGLHDSDLLHRLEVLDEAEGMRFDSGRLRAMDVDLV